LFGITKKTLSQLVKEFWLPFIAASGWTISAVYKQEITVQTVIANFGPSFFLASWMTGQFFRVRKQAGVESSLSLLEGRLSGVLDRLESSTLELTNQITGGTSFCAFTILKQHENESCWIATIHGSFPMYGVSARIIDLDLYEESFTGPQSIGAEEHLSIGDLSPTGGHISKLFDLGSGDSRRFNVFFLARNGIFVQNIKYKRVEGNWTWASKVFNEHGELGRFDQNYPRDENGNIWPINESDGSSSPSYQLSPRWN